MKFKLVAPFEPMGDQPTAINDLVKGLNGGERDQGIAWGDRVWEDLHRRKRH